MTQASAQTRTSTRSPSQPLNCRRPGQLPYQFWLLVIYLALLVVSCIDPTSLRDIAMQHAPTVAFLAFLVWGSIRSPLDRLSYTLIFIYLCTHLIGVEYLYSRVPYDTWFDWLFGFTPGERFDFQRNHYDRFVHLAFGLLLLHPLRVVVDRRINPRRGWAVVLAVSFVVVFSTSYELLEWGVAMTFDSENAESYNGQQGDMWDPHKDTLMAIFGAVVAAPIEIWLIRRSARR